MTFLLPVLPGDLPSGEANLLPVLPGDLPSGEAKVWCRAVEGVPGFVMVRLARPKHAILDTDSSETPFCLRPTLGTLWARSILGGHHQLTGFAGAYLTFCLQLRIQLCPSMSAFVLSQSLTSALAPI